MDLSSMYELRARLRAAMIAGTNLLTEDFRLKRAAEAFAPLEQAGPVFAKIGQLTRSLLSPEQEDREGALLDTITLVDAVLCTQGVVSVDGEVETIDGCSWGGTVTNAPYSVVKTLLDALLNSGSGHYSYVVDTHKERPELFEDYRVKAAMVRALGASYSELADEVAEWLKSEDVAILPLLQRDFDPKGKKEMVRRVRVMTGIDAARSNDFFVKMLPDAEKEVRQSLIYALRFVPENVDLLLELTKTEKSNAKKMAYYALAFMEDARAREAFVQLYKKKPVEAMQYLVSAETKWASDFVAEKLMEQLALWTADQAGVMTADQGDLLDATLAALPGKSGGAVCDAFRMAVGLGNRLHHPFEDKKKEWEGNKVLGVILPGVMHQYPRSVTFRSIIPYLLQQTLLFRPDRTLCALALELYGGERKEFFPMAVLSRLIDGGDCCDWLEEQLCRKGLSGEKKEEGIYPSLARGLGMLKYDRQSGGYVVCMKYNNYYPHPSGEPMPMHAHPVKQEIKGRFTDILMGCRDREVDHVLMSCIDKEDADYCRKLEDYFYGRALEVKDNRQYLHALKKCHCTRCQGVACHYFFANRQSKFSYYEIARFISWMPGDKDAICEELEKLGEMFRKGQMQMQGGAWDENRFREIVDNWKDGR